MIDDKRVIELAAKCQQYPGSKELTLRGPGILEFARALLVEHEISKVPIGFIEPEVGGIGGP